MMVKVTMAVVAIVRLCRGSRGLGEEDLKAFAQAYHFQHAVCNICHTDSEPSTPHGY